MTTTQTALTLWQPPGIVCYASDHYATAAIHQWWFAQWGIQVNSDPTVLRKANLYFVKPEKEKLKERIQSSTRKTIAKNLFDAANMVEAVIRQTGTKPKFILVVLECREKNLPPYQKIHYGGVLVIRQQAGPLLMYFGTVMEYFPLERMVGLSDVQAPALKGLAGLMSDNHVLIDNVRSALNGYVKPRIFS